MVYHPFIILAWINYHNGKTMIFLIPGFTLLSWTGRFFSCSGNIFWFFMQCVIIQHHHYSFECLIFSPNSSCQNSFKLAPVSSWQVSVSKSACLLYGILNFYRPRVIFFKESYLLLKKWYLESNNWAQGTCYTEVSLSRPFQEMGLEINFFYQEFILITSNSKLTSHDSSFHFTSFHIFISLLPKLEPRSQSH